jgi:hypothetical protein
MLRYFEIPVKEHRGWPGNAHIELNRQGIVITPCGASGAINEGNNHKYFIEISITDLLILAFKKIFASLRQF